MVLCAILLMLTIHTVHHWRNDHSADTTVPLDCHWVMGDGVGEGATENYLGDTADRTACVELAMKT